MLIDEVSVPHELQTVGVKILTGSKWKKTCKKHEIYSTENELYSHWQNLDEKSIRQVKHRSRCMIKQSNTLLRLYYYSF